MTTREAPSRWICDTCNDDITDPYNALLVFQDQGEIPWLRYDFRLVHKSIDGRRCDPGWEAGFSSNLELGDLLGVDGLTHLLSFLSAGPLKDGGGLRVQDMDGFVDLVRRLHIPNYEEARRRFDQAEVRDQYYDSTETAPYNQRELRAIVAMPPAN